MDLQAHEKEGPSHIVRRRQLQEGAKFPALEGEKILDPKTLSNQIWPNVISLSDIGIIGSGIM